MKHCLPALVLAAVLGSATAAGAATTGGPADALATPGTHVVLVDAQSGKSIGEYIAFLVKGTPVPSIAPPGTEFKRAFSDVAPLTIQQQNEAAERALESQGPPLHTP